MLMTQVKECRANFEPEDGRNLPVRRSITYWGVFCRTCQEPVAFDTPPYRASGLGGVHTRPGGICCERGHSHIYFPRDFRFFSSETPISEATMEANRAAYQTAKAS